MSHRGKSDEGTATPGPRPKATTKATGRRVDGRLTCCAALNARRLRALVAVARACRLAPRRSENGAYLARCPVCRHATRDRTLVIREATGRAGARFECRVCGAQGARPNGLQRLAEGRHLTANDDREAPPVDLPRVAAALARLDAAIDSHGDTARETCDRLADALIASLAVSPVQAANDDAEHLCLCAECEGRGDAGEVDA